MEKQAIRLSKPAEDQGSNNCKKTVWDCESSLYDSFELKSFEKQLDAAISAASRSLSMPHLSSSSSSSKISPNNNTPQPQPKHSENNNDSISSSKKPASKITRSFNRFIRSVFKNSRSSSSTYSNGKSTSGNKERPYNVVYEIMPTSVLSAIPESPEFDAMLSPDLRSITRRTASDRFDVPKSVGIPCS